MEVNGTIDVSDIHSLPEGIQLQFDVELMNSRFDASSPPTVVIQIRNLSGKKVEYLTGWFEVFGTFQSENRNPGLLLLPETWDVRTERPLRPTENYLIFDATLYTNRIGAGDTVCTRRTVWDHPRNEDAVFESGSYTFVSEYLDPNHELAFEWGFDLTVL